MEHRENHLLNLQSLALFSIISLASIAALSLLASGGDNPFFNATDIFTWKNDSKRILACLSRPCELSKFSPAYLLNSGLLSVYKAQMSIEYKHAMTSITGLVLWLNSIFLFVIAGINQVTHRWRRLTTVYAVFVLTPIASFYLYSGALELQAGAWLGTFLTSSSALLQKEQLPKRSAFGILTIFALSGFCFTLYKDLYGLYLILAVAITLALHKIPINSKRAKRILFASTAIISASLLNTCYSLFRYGTLLPAAYINENTSWQPSALSTLNYFWANIFSPNGGLLAFWGLSMAAVLIYFRIGNYGPDKYAITLSSVLLFIFTVTSSLWWSPFGWDAWGNRLTLPAIYGCLVGLIMTAQPVNRGRSKVYLLLTIAILVSISFEFQARPYLIGRAESWNRLLFQSPACRTMMAELKSGKFARSELWSSEIYLSCAQERLWRR